MNLAPFEASTAKFAKLLQKRCFNDCKKGPLYIWDRRDFGLDSFTPDAKACTTICGSCLLKKMTFDPPRPPEAKVEITWFADPDEKQTPIVDPNDLFKPTAAREPRARRPYKKREF